MHPITNSLVMDQQKAHYINANTVKIALTSGHKKTALYAYVYLVYCAHTGIQVFNNEIAAAIKSNTRIVKPTLEWLEDNGYITITSRDNRGLHYTIN